MKCVTLDPLAAIKQAAKRASENGRKTVRAHDFIIM